MGLYSLTVASSLLTCSKIIITSNVSIRKSISGCKFSFTFVLRFCIESISHLINGTGRRSVPSLKPTLIAIWLPFAAGAGAIAGAVDGAAGADAAATTTAAPTTTAAAATTPGAKDQGPALEEIVVTGLRASLEKSLDIKRTATVVLDSIN